MVSPYCYCCYYSVLHSKQRPQSDSCLISLVYCRLSFLFPFFSCPFLYTPYSSLIITLSCYRDSSLSIFWSCCPGPHINYSPHSRPPLRVAPDWAERRIHGRLHHHIHILHLHHHHNIASPTSYFLRFSSLLSLFLYPYHILFYTTPSYYSLLTPS